MRARVHREQMYQNVDGTWTAYSTIKREHHTLGTFNTQDEAREAQNTVPLRRNMDTKVYTYHKKRRPFFLRPDGFIYVTQGYPGTHEQWAKQLGLPAKAMEDWPRGFYWPATDSLYFYVGMYTTDYERVVDAVKKSLKMLLFKLNASEDFTIIYGGMKPGEPGTVWEPVHKFGTSEQFK